MNSRKIGLYLGPILFILARFFLELEGLSDQANAVLASTLWIAIWWITEAIPIAATSLLPIILFPLSGALPLADTTSSFGHRFVFLYLGGFILALAIQKWNLHKRIALNIIKVVGTNVQKIILGFMVATAFLSMWISNTATAVMMLPIGIAIIKQMKDLKNTSEDENLIFGKALMLSIAYSASIGGIATLIGTPPNLVFAGIIQETYNIEISFLKWFQFGLPISILLLAISWVYLTKVAFKFKQNEFNKGKEEINRQLEELGSISYEEKIVLSVFVLTGLAWILRTYLLNKFIPNLDDSIIALISGISLFLFQANNQEGKKEKIMNWEDAVKLPWGILLLFGGGLALAKGMASSGLVAVITEGIKSGGFSPIIVVCLLIVLMLFMTELMSNVALVAVLAPVVAGIAIGLNIPILNVLIPVTMASSCAFMLPMATPPNAIVFASGYVKVSEMARAGIILNVLAVGLLILYYLFVIPIIF